LNLNFPGCDISLKRRSKILSRHDLIAMLFFSCSLPHSLLTPHSLPQAAHPRPLESPFPPQNDKLNKNLFTISFFKKECDMMKYKFSFSYGYDQKTTVMNMEKWQLAGIISSGSKRPALILPVEKRRRNHKPPEIPRGKNKVSTLLRSTIRKVTQVIALF
jgi:hypothetical protein